MRLNFLILAVINLLTIGGPEITFPNNRILDMGDVKQGTSLKVTVPVKNSGDEPLYIYSANKSCNCTNVEFSRKPLYPNDERDILITIDTTGKYGKEAIVVNLVMNTEKVYAIIRINLNVTL